MLLYALGDFFKLPLRATRSPACPPAHLRGAVLALLPICYTCVSAIELNSFSVCNDNYYQLIDFNNDYQLITVFQKGISNSISFEAAGSILRCSIYW